MQSSDGGWAAFDVDNNWQFLSQVPFADHNAMLDPTCPDITGRVLEALAAHGVDARASGGAARRRVAGAQPGSRMEAGTGAGAWLTFTAPASRCAAWRRPAKATAKPTCCARGEWLRSIQNADGGWGESCASYDNGVFTAAPQHAFADRLGDSGPDRRRRRRQPQRAARHRISAAKRSAPMEAGTKNLATGTGFPKVFYLNYHLYKDYFPLLALASFVKTRARRPEWIDYEISHLA